ncbi:MAG: DUF4179 domain-containing protein [Sarcina sp.]
MDDKNLRDLIDIPTDLDAAVLDGIKKGRDEKREKKNSMVKKGFIAASFSLVLAGGIAIINPEIVSAIPGVNKIFEEFNSALFGESTEKFAPFTKNVGARVEDNGIDVTLDELVFDDNNLILALEIKGEALKGFEGTNYSDFVQMSEHLFIDGAEVVAQSSPTKSSEDTAQVILQANIAKMKVKNNANIELKIRSIGRGNKSTEGEWNLKVSADKVAGKKISINEEFNSELGKFRVNNVSMTELSTNIMLDGQYTNAESFYDTQFMIKDENGRIIPFKMLSNSCDENKSFERHIEIKENLEGTDKVIISVVNGAKTIDKEKSGVVHNLIQFNGDKDMKFTDKILSRKPTKKEVDAGFVGTSVDAYVNINEGNHKSLNELIDEKIHVSNDAVIEIIDIEDTEDGTKFKFKVNGYYDYLNLTSLTAVDEEMNFITRREGQRLPAIEDAKNNIYSMSIDKLDKNKKYAIGVPKITDLEESSLNMEIDLSK